MTILTLAEMQERLAQFTYKLGWTFRIYEGHTEGPMLEILADVDDSVKKGEYVKLEVYSHIPPQVSIDSFDLFLFDRIKRLEIHECMEFWQIGGVPRFNPHAAFSDRGLL